MLADRDLYLWSAENPAMNGQDKRRSQNCCFSKYCLSVFNNKDQMNMKKTRNLPLFKFSVDIFIGQI